MAITIQPIKDNRNGQTPDNGAQMVDKINSNFKNVSEGIGEVDGDAVHLGDQSSQVNYETPKTSADMAIQAVKDDKGNVIRDTYSTNMATGINEFPEFSDKGVYNAGDIVRKDGRIYEFTQAHSSKPWIGTDARETSLRGEVRNIDNSIMEYNVSMHNGWSKYTLVEAIALVPNRLRRLGQKVSFINSLTGLAETWMYIGTDSNEWGITNFVASDAGFYGQIFDTIESPYNIDNIKSTGFYIKKNGNPYILIVKAEKGAEIYQVRFYVPDFTDKVVLGKRKYSTSTNSWTSWVNQEIITQDLLDALSSTIYSFDGFIETNDSDADNFIDKVTTTGVYKRAKNGYPIIYFVKTVNGIVYQTQLYYNDSLTLVFKVRRLNSGVWTEWSNQTFVLI